MFSLKKLNDKSIGVGRIDGGKYDEQIIYFNEENVNNDMEYNIKINSLINDIMENKKYFADLKGKAKRETKQKIREHLLKNIPPIEDNIRKRYDIMKNDIIKKGNKQLEIYDGEIKPYCNKDKREIYYICAPSGAGKSYFMNEYAKSYQQQYPKNNIFLFSKLDEDTTLDKNKKLKRIIINEDLLNEPIDASEMKDSLILFDDTMMIRDQALNKELNEHLLKDVLETGRHYNENVCITNHLINEYKKTRPLMNESTHLVFFLRGGNRYSMNYCLSKYVGLDKHQINRIFKLHSRWVIINKQTYPMTIIHQNGCYVLDDEVNIEHNNNIDVEKYREIPKEKPAMFKKKTLSDIMYDIEHTNYSLPFQKKLSTPVYKQKYIEKTESENENYSESDNDSSENSESSNYSTDEE